MLGAVGCAGVHACGPRVRGAGRARPRPTLRSTRRRATLRRAERVASNDLLRPAAGRRRGAVEARRGRLRQLLVRHLRDRGRAADPRGCARAASSPSSTTLRRPHSSRSRWASMCRSRRRRSTSSAPARDARRDHRGRGRWPSARARSASLSALVLIDVDLAQRGPRTMAGAPRTSLGDRPSPRRVDRPPTRGGARAPPGAAERSRACALETRLHRRVGSLGIVLKPVGAKAFAALSTASSSSPRRVVGRVQEPDDADPPEEVRSATKWSSPGRAPDPRRAGASGRPDRRSRRRDSRDCAPHCEREPRSFRK